MKSRTLIRKQGWTPVDVSRLEIDWKTAWYDRDYDQDDKTHYQEIKQWCEEFVGNENYVSTIQQGTSKHCVKRFIFKHAKHATMFRLRWS